MCLAPCFYLPDHIKILWTGLFVTGFVENEQADAARDIIWTCLARPNSQAARAEQTISAPEAQSPTSIPGKCDDYGHTRSSRTFIVPDRMKEKKNSKHTRCTLSFFEGESTQGHTHCTRVASHGWIQRDVGRGWKRADSASTYLSLVANRIVMLLWNVIRRRGYSSKYRYFTTPKLSYFFSAVAML